MPFTKRSVLMTSLTADLSNKILCRIEGSHLKDLSKISDSRESKLQRPCLDLSPEGSKLFVVSTKTLLELGKFLALFLLDRQGDLAASVKESSDDHEILLSAPTCCHGRRTDTHTTWGQCGYIPMHGIAVQRDGSSFAHFLNLTAGEAMWPEVPQDKVVV